VPVATRGSWSARGGASGPVIGDTLSVGVAFAHVSRDGFTVNDVTGRQLDDRSAFSAKGQVLWTPTPSWEARVIVTGERARDGDYALNDVAALRANPFHASRDVEGSTDRDIIGTTVLARHTGSRVVFSSTTGFLNWKTRDITDLDYTPQPILTRDNTEQDFQFTQELRLASAQPLALGQHARLRWQGGVFLFTQSYEQDAVNSYSPFVIGPSAVSEHSPLSSLDDAGIGVFGQATVALSTRLEITGGARVDYENRSAALESFYEPAIAPRQLVDAERSFSNVSPHAAVSYRLVPDQTLYATAGRGYKAGGFNAASPVGRGAYGEERAWHFEGGVKTLFASGRIAANAAVFYIDWSDLQLNVPDPAVPAQFYIANVGSAVSKGAELELSARAAPGIDLFTALGYTHARFGADSVSSGFGVGGNEIPNTPEYTLTAGLQYSRDLGPATLQGRADVVRYGAFQYNDVNTLGQDAYALVNVRLGLSGRRLSGELFVRNAFDSRYIPFAFAYGNFAPSGFVGEMGAPRIVGASATIRF
jgi:iron complex outermembrane receptor protein